MRRGIYRHINGCIHMSLKHAITFDAIRFSALLDEETYQERLASYFKKMLQRIRNVLQVTWRRCYGVAGKSCKLLDVLQRIRNVLQVTWRRCCNVSGTSCKLWYVVTRQVTCKTFLLRRNIFVKWLARRSWYVVTSSAGTSCMLLEQVVPTYQERLTSYLKKMLQRFK